MKVESKGKTVAMEEGKLSYEQLKMLLDQSGMQNKQLLNQLAAANYTNLFKRLEFLFKVIENKDSFNSDFVVECVEEVEDILHIPEEEKEVKETK